MVVRVTHEGDARIIISFKQYHGSSIGTTTPETIHHHQHGIVATRFVYNHDGSTTTTTTATATSAVHVLQHVASIINTIQQHGIVTARIPTHDGSTTTTTAPANVFQYVVITLVRNATSARDEWTTTTHGWWWWWWWTKSPAYV